MRKTVPSHELHVELHVFCIFSVYFGPLYDMCADLTHRKFSSDVDKVVADCYKLGKLYFNRVYFGFSNCQGK